MPFGVIDIGAYIPRLRLDRGAIAAAHKWMAPSLAGSAKGERAFCSFDEDAVTMSVEALRDGVPAAERARVRGLILASTPLPYADLSNAAIVAAAADLPSDIQATESTGSQRAATSALIQALRTGAEDTVIVATERPQAKPASAQEKQFGAGAASLRLGKGEVIARFLGAGSVSLNFPDHVRAEGANDPYFWEERWIRDEGCGKLIPPAVKAALATSCGMAGAAHAFLMLARVLETAGAGQRILVVGFWQGADAIVLEATGKRASGRGVSAALADKMVPQDYLRVLSFYGRIELDWRMRAEGAEKAALTNA